MVGIVGILIFIELLFVLNLYGDFVIFFLIVNVLVLMFAVNILVFIKKEEKIAAVIIECFIICFLIKFIFGC